MARVIRTGGPGVLVQGAFLAGFLGVAGCSEGQAPPAPPPPGSGFALDAELVVDGLESPVYLTSPDGDGRRFVVEQPGRIRIVDPNGSLQPAPFLDLTARVRSGGERGLFSMAFHPAYATNGFFYVNFTASDGSTRVERFRVSMDPDLADSGSATPILRVAQPFANHNGGQVAFGPDGMLFVFMGDGGSGGDPLGSGQDPGTLLGAVLRLDVDAGAPFVPADNPFVGLTGVRDEIWALGVRNPWRASFDPPGGTLYLADVGQDRFEEINAASATAGGLNFGWNILEGPACFGGGSCDTSPFTFPVETYDHSQGCSITGGFVYRGSRIPEAVGHYFYSDFCSGFLRSFRLENGVATDRRSWDTPALGSVLSFGRDADGELYVLSSDGRVLRLGPAS